MCRLSKACAIASLSLVVALLTPEALAMSAPRQAAHGKSAESNEALEQYLQRRELNELLIESLAGRVKKARGAERLRIADRLADLYIKQMKASSSPDQMSRIEQGARALMELVPQNDSIDLRLKLLRSLYTRAEKKAERWRLRLAPEKERDESLQSFSALSRDLDQIGTYANRVVEELRRQEESGRTYDVDLLEKNLTKARSQRSLARYLAGWSETYIAEMTNNKSLAMEAMRSFGWLLGAPHNERPTLDRLDAGNLRFEHVARSAIGVAVCLSVRHEAQEALQWLDAVESAEGAPDVVAGELAARRLTILASAQRWYDLDRFAMARRKVGSPGGDGGVTPLSVGEARLLAVATLEAVARTPQIRKTVRSLSRIAIADLIARNEIGQALDLARRYGVESLGDDGFLALHIRGLIDYEKAREAHESSDADAEAPATEPAVAQAYIKAAGAFRKALEADDAKQQSETRAHAMTLLGMSLYYSAGGSNKRNDARRLIDASDSLRKASQSLSDPAQRANALAAAIRAVTLAIDLHAGRDNNLRPVRDEMVNAFLKEHPGDARVGGFLLRRATETQQPKEASLELLLRVPAGSNAYEAARRRASRLLYDLRRASSPDRRDWASMRYVEVAEPIFLIDAARAAAGDQSAHSLAVTRGRRMLEALLNVRAPDAERAQRILSHVQLLLAGNVSEAGRELEEELTYRRAQIAIWRGDLDEAQRLAATLSDSVSEQATGDERIPAGAYLLFRNAAQRWRDSKRAGAPKEAQIIKARAVVRQGASLIRAAGLNTTADQSDAALSVHAALAEAAADLWSLTGDVDARSLAIEEHRRVLDARPTSAAFLVRLAALSEQAGDLQTALRCWRTLSAGRRQGEDAWFEARSHLISLLLRTDPPRGRLALRQHKAMYPGFGPAPWGDAIRALDAEVEASP